MSTAVREYKSFTGSVHTDPTPERADAGEIRQVHMFDVPASLREHAAWALGDMPGGAWWTVGQFRYTDSPALKTAVARRMGAQIQYGIEN